MHLAAGEESFVPPGSSYGSIREESEGLQVRLAFSSHNGEVAFALLILETMVSAHIPGVGPNAHFIGKKIHNVSVTPDVPRRDL